MIGRVRGCCVPALSLWNTWNVARLTSAISSSSSIVSWLNIGLCVGASANGAPVAADAPPASDNDNPAAPKTDMALLPRFRFEACFVRCKIPSQRDK
jgi:hypothetical protein